MKIGIDLTETCRPNWTGSAYFVRETVQALLRVASEDRFGFYQRLSRFKHRAHAFCPEGHRVHWFQEPVWPIRAKVDLIHGFGTRVPVWRHAARVVTLFDVIPMLPEARGWVSKRFIERRRTQCLRLSKHCDLILASSEATRTDYLERFSFPEDRIQVVYGGVDRRFNPDHRRRFEELQRQTHLPKDYILFAGAQEPRKNVERLVEAFVRSRASRETVLVLAGGSEAGWRGMLPEKLQQEAGDRLCFPGYVTDDLLPVLYASARAFAFPSLYEGFGLPVLEAMASGLPILVGNRGAASETGGGYAVSVDPYDVEAMADGIDRTLEIPTDQVEKAREYASSFTWERCASETHAHYRRLVG